MQVEVTPRVSFARGEAPYEPGGEHPGKVAQHPCRMLDEGELWLRRGTTDAVQSRLRHRTSSATWSVPAAKRMPPLPLATFLAANRATAVQIQRDRFQSAWRRVGPDDPQSAGNPPPGTFREPEGARDGVTLPFRHSRDDAPAVAAACTTSDG